MSPRVIPGIHHVTAIAGDPQANLDFYTQVLGLRLVKKTVNFDDPGTYHFYFGDAVGAPGTILTFFPWPGAYPGRAGAGMAAATAYSIRAGSLDYWMERLAEVYGNFDAPMLVHDSKDVPGTRTMAARKSLIRYQYVETPAGGRVDITTTDADGLAAVHDFLRFQIADHGTGDATTVRKR